MNPATALLSPRFHLCLGCVLILLFGSMQAAEPPPVSYPRATSGDSVAEPAWSERLTITVGPDHADLSGTTERV